MGEKEARVARRGQSVRRLSSVPRRVFPLLAISPASLVLAWFRKLRWLMREQIFPPVQSTLVCCQAGWDRSWSDNERRMITAYPVTVWEFLCSRSSQNPQEWVVPLHKPARHGFSVDAGEAKAQRRRRGSERYACGDFLRRWLHP